MKEIVKQFSGDKMDLDIVKKEIDKWDPIDLLAYSPQDEYDFESKEISLKLQFDVKQNGIIIFEVFSNAFGDTFTKSVDECISVAEKIMKHANLL
jgi:hypothetical protein